MTKHYLAGRRCDLGRYPVPPVIKMFSRAGRAAMFDRKAFTKAFFDDDAAADGAIVVASVGALTYFGRLFWLGAFGFFSIGGLLESLLASVVSWLILAFATWFAATRLFNSGGRPQAMIALHGLAALPLLLEIPVSLERATFDLVDLIAGVGLIWYLAVLVLATREASDLDVRNAAVAVLIGFAAAALVRALLGVPFAVFSSVF